MGEGGERLGGEGRLVTNVVPAKAGTQLDVENTLLMNFLVFLNWVPAFAGTTAPER
jgi:hypothetical protein